MSYFPGFRVLAYGSNAALAKASSTFNILLGAGLPFCVIFVSNVTIIATLRKVASARAALRTNSKDKGGQEELHLTVMLIFVSAAYIVMTLPYRLYTPVFEIPAIKMMYDMTDTFWYLRYYVGAMVVAALFICNYGSNFYLYVIGGGSRFRNDTKEVLFAMLKCKYSTK